MLDILKKYRFVILIAFLILWVLFFARYDLFSVYNHKKELDELKKRITYLEDEIKKIEIQRQKLETDPGTIEKESRERYYMKKDNEDVFIFDSTERKE